MKLAFSTLGVPGLPVADVVRLATAHGYHGVELRAHPEEPVHPGIGPAERADVAAEFKAGGIEILGLAGYARVAAPGDDTAVLTEIRELLDLARDLGAPFIRVFPGAGTDQSPEEADATAARRLGTAAEYATEAGVRILLETHDSHRTGADAIRVLGPVGHRQVGSLWDVMHLARRRAAVVDVRGTVPVPRLRPGQGHRVRRGHDPAAARGGVLPLTECVELLSRAGWDGWLCWEYEKRWYEEAAPLAGLLGPGREHLARLLNESA